MAKGDAAYMLTLISRSADFLANDRLITKDMAEKLKGEAEARISDESFFGFISFNSVIAWRPS